MFRLLIASLLAFHCILFADLSFAAETDEGKVLDRLRAQWEHQESSLQTVEIHFRAVRRKSNSKLDHGRVIALLSQANLVGNEGAQKNLIGSLDTTLKGKDELWANNIFILDGKDSREDSSYSGRISSHATAEDYEIRKRSLDSQGQDQIDIFDRGASRIHRTSVDEFNYFPSPGFRKNAVLAEQVVTDGAESRLRIKGGGEAVVDEHTGFVYEYRGGTLERGEFRETFQYGPKQYPGDMIFPTVIFSGTYVDGTLNLFRLWMIDSVTINEEFQEDAFIVDGKPNDVVVDHRKGKQVVSLTQYLRDVLQHPQSP